MPTQQATLHNFEYVSDAEIVNKLHEEVDFIESECSDLLCKDFRGTYRTHLMKSFITKDGLPARKVINVTVIDNTKRWELMNELYWHQAIQVPLMMREAG